MTCKATLHIQRTLDWMRGSLDNLGAQWVKIVDPGAGPDPFPGQRKILRFHTDAWDKDCIARGRAGAEEYMSKMLPRWREFTGWGNPVFELPNEPDVNSNFGLAMLNEFTIRCIEIANAEGFTVAVFCIAEGNPGGDEAAARWKMQQLTEAAKLAVKHGHYLAFHAYWKPGVEGPTGQYHALRYRANMRYLAEAGLDITRAKVLITEAGIDGLINSGERQGWRSLNPDGYADDVVTYERELRKDRYIECFCLFTAGFFPPWGDYDHDKAIMDRITPGIRALGDLNKTEQPQEEPPMGYEGSFSIVGKRFTPDEFERYVEALPAIKRRLVVIHHTYKPDTERWMEFGGQYWMQALLRHYSSLGWSGGPHLFVAPDGIWVFNPLDRDGIHVRGWNEGTWGVEIVGDYRYRLPEGPTLTNAVAAVSILLRKISEGTDILAYHHQLNRDTDCPGAKFMEHWMWFVEQVRDKLSPALAYLPENDPAKTPLEICIAARWWNEEMTRTFEQNDFDRLYSLLLSQSKLLYRVENILKANS